MITENKKKHTQEEEKIAAELLLLILGYNLRKYTYKKQNI